jgi:Prolipoprotein diacylglyceryl transferase
MTSYGDAFNRLLDTTVHPRLRVLNRQRSAFQVCGYTGLAFAILLAMSLVLYRGLSPWVMAGVVAAAMITFLALAMVTKIITGHESLTYYHQEIAVLMVAAGLLALLRQPVLAFLDITLLGVGLFLVCGRVGCLMIGCCHGRPHRWGVCYRHEHAEAGFSAYFVGVRLFPVQLVEAVWVMGIVAIGGAMVWRGDAPGTALAWYVVMYDLGRFFFEFVRGDLGRPYWLGFSEAQWISVLLMACVVVGEWRGDMPYHAWHTLVLAGLVLVIVTVAVMQRRRSTGQLLCLSHVHEVAAALGHVSTLADIRVERTSLGIQISSSQIADGATSINQYTLSHEQGMMTDERAAALAKLITQLKHPSSSNRLVQGNRGVFHLLVHHEKAATN